MLAKTFLVCVIVLATTAANEGCYHQNVGAAEGSMPDSVSGVVSVNGTSFDHHLVLRANDKVIALSVSPADSVALTNVAGVEVLVRGDLDGSTMRVTSFTAMRVGGAPVVDGVLVNNAGQLYLKTSSGMRLVGNPPAKLREMISARVWIGGPLDTGPNNYGVIMPAVLRR